MSVLCLNFWGTAKVFSGVAAPCTFPPDIPVGSIAAFSQEFTVFFILIILLCVNRHVVVSICVSLMANSIEYFFIYLLAIHMSSLEKCPVKSFDHISVGWFVLLLNCKCSLYILKTNPLSDVWFANIFPQFVGCLSTISHKSICWQLRVLLCQHWALDQSALKLVLNKFMIECLWHGPF